MKPGLALLWVCFMIQLASAQTVNTSAFKGFTNLDSFSKVTPFGPPGETDYLSPEIEAGIDWNELVASWDVQASAGAQVSIAARAVYPDHSTKFYILGIWTPDQKVVPRTSVDGQKDADGTVATDTLQLVQKARKVQILIASKPGADGTLPSIRFLGLSFADSTPKAAPADTPIAELVPLDVPRKCQMDYPNGGGYCSATSVSMVLCYWADKLQRPELRKDVPEVVDGVYDKAFDGTGNWPFNTAYAGSFSGMRAYVTRFTSTDEIREWLAMGIPVITSGSLPLLEGKVRPKNDPGHLFVALGFDKNGDPIFNDPGHSDVRRTYKRADFEKAWDVSDRTVYLIYPESMTPPSDPLGHWFTG